VAEDTYISPGYFAHGVTWEWCRRGLLTPQIERLKALYAPRLEACLAAVDKYMPDAQATRPDGGFFVSLTLPMGTLTTELRTEALKRNLNLADGLAFFPEGGGERFLRLPFCALTPDQINEGISRTGRHSERNSAKHIGERPPEGTASCMNSQGPHDYFDENYVREWAGVANSRRPFRAEFFDAFAPR
jgi:DNA-binding transcriptional MocR family regulator